jgi:GTPase
MFIDEARIYIEGGRGGDGCVSFLREKYRPRGGPDGASGGKGGDVVVEATNSVSTLSEFARRRHFKAHPGSRGGSRDKKGARGRDVIVLVPTGTVVRDEDGRALADLVEAGQRFVAAPGGRGGRGNSSLVGEVGPLPRFAEKGEPGRQMQVALELKLVADVAIVGFPNAGKSSLISRISAARPRIADYPFTTVEPNLGVVVLDDDDLVVTDVPGLVEGAHQGKGMGIAFLRHIERASVILFLVDMSPMSGRRPVEDLLVLRGELEGYKEALATRRMLVAANKMDLNPEEDVLAELRAQCRAEGLELFEISAVTGRGVKELVRALAEQVALAREEGTSTGEQVVYEPPADEDAMSVCVEDGRFIVTSGRLERLVSMTDWSNDAAVSHLALKLKDAGVEDAAAAAGAAAGDEIEIAGRTFEYIPDSFGLKGEADGQEDAGHGDGREDG